MTRNVRYGHPNAYPLHDRELKQYRGLIVEGLDRLSRHPAMQASMKLAEGILVWQPRYGWTGELEAREAFRWMQDGGVQPMQILQRVAEVYAVEKFSARARFRNKRERTYALARAVLRLRSLGNWRPTARVLQFVGAVIEEHLEGFAVSLLNRLSRELAAREELKQASRAFD